MFVGVHKTLRVDGSLLFVSIGLLIIGFRQATLSGAVCVFIAGILLGSWRTGTYLEVSRTYSRYIGYEVVVHGRVSEDPTIGVNGDTRVRVSVEQIDDAKVEPLDIWVSSSQNSSIKRSDRIVLNGVMAAGFGTYAGSMYRAGIVSVSRADYADVARDVRDSFASGVRAGIDEPEASLAVGFLLGQKSELPEHLQAELRLLGLTHIVVASGYNLTILVRFARRFFMRISRFSALAASGLLIYIFTQMTGYTPSMSRASLIASLSLVAWYFGRNIHPFVLLPFAAAITLLVRPAYAEGDIGWMLSFSSFIGVIIFAPLVHAYFWGVRKPKAVRQVVIETLSAQVVTLPIILFVFGAFSPLALPANVLIVPLIPLVMLLSFIGGISGLIYAPLAWLIALPSEMLLRYMTWVVEKMSQVPLASRTLSIGVEAVIVLYLFIFVAIVYMWRRTGYEFHKSNLIE